MAQTLDGVSSTASQHGAKQLKLPLQEVGNFYATEARRQMIAAPASAYAPIRSQLTGYTLRLKWSDDLSQADWTKNATTGTASAATSPEGSTNASKLAEDNTTAAHNATQAMTVAAGALRGVVLLKAGERTFARLRFNNATDGNLGATVFNLSTGAIVSGTGQIKALLNGWYACFIFGTATVTNSALFIDLSTDGTTFSYLGVTGSGIYVWRATAYLASSYGPAVQTTNATRACTSCAVDDDDPTAFLVEEQEPEASTLEMGVARWGRRFANVPADLVRYSSRSITKPTIPNESVNSFAVLAALTEVATGTAVLNNTGFWASDDKVYAPFVTLNNAITIIAATAGTFTLTYKANTTGALAFNAADATIAAALNGLASVIADGLTYTVFSAIDTGGSAIIQFTITAGTTTTAVTLNASGLTVSNNAAKTTYSYFTSATQQSAVLGRVLSAPSHGLAGGTSLLLVTSNVSLAVQTAYLFTSAQWAVFDANTLSVIIWPTYPTINYLAAYLRTYTPGSVVLPSRVTDKFYLPGITLGVNAATDIPITSPNMSDADVIAAVLNDTGYQPVEFNGPDYWDGRAPIYRTTTVEINFDQL